VDNVLFVLILSKGGLDDERKKSFQKRTTLHQRVHS